MCRFKSGIILEDRVFVPDYDHHTQMLEELKIADDSERPQFVRAELVPPNGDAFSSIDKWELIIDQDFIPKWFVTEYDEARMKDAVKNWARSHIYIGVDGLELSSGESYYLKDCKGTVLSGSSTVEQMSGSSTVEWMSGSSTVERMCDSSTVEWMSGSSTVERMSGSSTVERMCDSSTVEWMSGSSTVERMCDSSTVEWMSGSSTVERMCDSSTVFIPDTSLAKVSVSATVLSQNARIVDARTKTIFQSGDWTLRLV